MGASTYVGAGLVVSVAIGLGWLYSIVPPQAPPPPHPPPPPPPPPPTSYLCNLAMSAQVNPLPSAAELRAWHIATDKNEQNRPRERSPDPLCRIGAYRAAPRCAAPRRPSLPGWAAYRRAGLKHPLRELGGYKG